MLEKLGTWPGLAVALLTVTPAAWSQEMSLSQALEYADTQAFANRMASLNWQASKGQNLSASASFLPVVRGEVGVMATDDPLASFGTRLSQRRVSMASFNPATLNDPDVTGGWNAAVIAEVPLVNVDAWQAKRMTGTMTEAKRLETLATRHQMRAEILQSWTAVAVAQDALKTWEAAVVAIESQERKVASVVRNGMANRADQLLVSVKASEYRTQRNKAQSDVELAKSQVQFLLGSEKPLVLQNPSLPSEQRLRDVVGQSRVDTLSLSQAIGARHAEMAQTDLLRTRFAFMPRLNGMARMDWKERDLDALPDPSWTVGVTASWALFQGAKDWGDMHAARARRDMAKVGLQQLKAREQLDAQATQAQLTTSLEKMQTESAAIVQAEEALRILSLQYEQGLAEIGDVLQTQAMLIQQRLSLAATRHTVLTSLAHQSLLKGRDPAFLASLMQ